MNRRGFSIIEVLLAIALTAVTTVAAVQLLAALAAQQRADREREIALQETANALEQVAALPWAELTSERVEQIQVSPQVAERLPEAKLAIALAEAPGPPAGRRVSVELSWRKAAGERGKPLRLTAWRFAPKEAAP